MNFGYFNESLGWKEERKYELADRIIELLQSKGFRRPARYRGQPIPQDFFNHNHEPYVDVDWFYPGVRIRMVTGLSESELNMLWDEADEIYKEVMDIKPEDSE
jgi:hypothetical protein